MRKRDEQEILREAQEKINNQRLCEKLKGFTEQEHAQYQAEMIDKLLNLLYDAENLSSAIDKMMEIIAEFYDAERSYIFEQERDGTLSNTYEWCKEGIIPQIDNLQHVSHDTVQAFYEAMTERTVFCLRDFKKEVLPGTPLYEILEPQGINSLLIAPLNVNDITAGFIGVDNPSDPDKNLLFLRLCASFIEHELERQRYNSREQAVINALAAEYTCVFHYDPSTDKVMIYSLNDHLQALFGDTLKDASYNEVYEDFLAKAVAPIDRAHMLETVSRDNLFKALKEHGELRFIYQNEQNQFCEYKAIYADETKSAIIIGVSSRGEQVIGEYISKHLQEDYIGIFLVDYDSDTYRAFKKPDTSQLMTKRADNCWSHLIADLLEECSDDTKDIVSLFADPKALEKNLTGAKRREYIYRHVPSEYPWRRAVVQITNRKDGLPLTAIIAISFLDVAVAEREELNARIQRQNKLLEENQILLEEHQALLTETTEKAEAANKAKSNFLFNMSHDIRTPMNAILGFNRLAESNINNPERLKDYLKKISDAGEHLLSIINDVLDMARIESGKIELDAVNTNCETRLFTIIEMLKTLADDKGIEFITRVENVKHTNLILDSLRMEQVLVNVISNAIKYTPKGGKVEYIIEETEPLETGKARFRHTVKDTGIGMSEEFIKTIFDSFSREKNSTLSGVQGTGLGMAIVKRIINLMGGTIEVSSTLGKGTTVVIEVEFLIVKNDSDDTEQTADDDLDFTGMKLLLVEDNDLNREIARESLMEFGVSVDEANDGTVAVSKLENALPGDYDLILMDIQMPIMDGYKATHAIRRLPDKAVAAIPIVAMTANVFDEDKKKARDSGMDGHLGKPIEMNELLKVLKKYKP